MANPPTKPGNKLNSATSVTNNTTGTDGAGSATGTVPNNTNGVASAGNATTSTSANNATNTQHSTQLFELVSGSNKYTLTPFGLVNVNVMCYANSLLQAIASCSSFNQIMIENKQTLMENPIAKLYIEMIEKHFSWHPSKLNELTIERSVFFLREMFTHLKARKDKVQFGNGQEDANEFFHYMIDFMNSGTVSKRFAHFYTTHIYCQFCRAKVSTIQHNASYHFEIDHADQKTKMGIPDNFYIQSHNVIPVEQSAIQGTTIATQGATQVANQATTAIAQGANQGVNQATTAVVQGTNQGAIAQTTAPKYYKNCMDNKQLQDKFQKFLLSHNELAEDYLCEKCNKRGNAIRRDLLTMIPEVIVIHFRKYSNKTMMYFPRIIEFPSELYGTLTFEIVSQVEHQGTASGGHYTAIGNRLDIKDSTKKSTYLFNDTGVQECEDFAITPNTYMVFYNFAQNASRFVPRS